jgi:hypothetical protein
MSEADLSANANAASRQAFVSDTKQDHRKAAVAHKAAAEAQDFRSTEGKRRRDMHLSRAKDHRLAAGDSASDSASPPHDPPSEENLREGAADDAKDDGSPLNAWLKKRSAKSA